MKKRLLSLLLALVMVVSMLPVQALADEVDETGNEPEMLQTLTTGEETEAPEKETEAPEKETEAPEKETEAPEEETEVPEKETEAPEEETEAPEEETEAPEETAPVLKLWDAEAELPMVDGSYALTLTVGSPVALTVKRGEDICADYTFRTESQALTLSRDEDTGLITLEPVEAASDVSVTFTDNRDEAAEVTLIVEILPAEEPVPEEETEAPTEETEAPEEETEAPEEETEAPREETEASEEENLPESETTVTDPARLESIQEEETSDSAPAATLFITNLPETLRMGSKALTLKVADANNAAYKGALTWELRASEGNQNDAAVYYLLNAMATLSSKGVLTTSAVYDERVKIEVRAVADENTFTDWTAVTLVPPVESFWVGAASDRDLAAEESRDGGVNRKDNWPWNFDINVDYVLLWVDEVLPEAASPDVSWSIKVNSKVADYQIQDDGRVKIIPKTPGKLTFTATAKDGSGAKYSGSIEFYGNIHHLEMADPAEYTLKAGESHTYRVNAWYDQKGSRPIANPEVYWSVYELDGPEEEPYRIFTELATISKTGVLKVSKNVAKNATLLVVADFWGFDRQTGQWGPQEASVKVNIRPAKEKTLVIAFKGWDGTLSEMNSNWWVTPESTLRVTAAFYDSTSGQLEEAADVPLTVKNAAYDRTTGEITCGTKENVKVTISASYQKQKASVSLTVGNRSEQVKVTTEVVPSGKSTNLTAESLFENWNTGEYEKTKLQKFTWYLSDPYIFSDESCVYGSIVEGVTPKLTKSGKLTVPKLDYDGYIRVFVLDAYYSGQEVIIRVSAIKQTKATLRINSGTVPYNSYNDNVALNFLDPDAEAHITASDCWVSVLVNGRDYTGSQLEITGLTVSNPKIAKPAYDSNNQLLGVKFTGTPGTVTFTITGNTVPQDGEASVPFTVKKTLKAINAVESVTLNGPTKGVVGKSLNLKPVVNKEATNKKLHWYIRSSSLYGGFCDKTSIKNGVIKFDNSFYTESRTYTVACWSDDGFYYNEWEVEAEAAATAIAIVCPTGAINGTTQKLAVDDELPLTITAMAGGTLLPNPTVTVKSSNNKVASAMYLEDMGVWVIIGNKPGTATITVTGNSGKKATFKVTVTNQEFPEPR